MAFGRLGRLEERLTQIGLTNMVWKFHRVRNDDASTANSEKYAAFVLIASISDSSRGRCTISSRSVRSWKMT